jgi:hypothetical protein
VSEQTLRTESFPPALASARRARRVVEEQITDWGLDAILESAALCSGELAANAILHTRQPFTVTLRRTATGARIDVIDLVPDQLPLIAPSGGTGEDILRSGRTGRGLRLIAAVARRWGAFTAGPTKSVWAELDLSGAPAAPTDAVLVDNRPPVESATTRTITYRDLPVRAAIASGVQLEEAVRHIQLSGERAASWLAPVGLEEFFSLLDRSAPVRLAGRHAAFLASGANQKRFDLEVTAEADAFVALISLAPLLARVSPATAQLHGVVDFRQWLTDEAARQGQGLRPSACRLPP